MKKNYSEKPLIGFILHFNCLGETYPFVAIAKKYIELGGKVIFFGYGTKYQYLSKDIGCKTIHLTKDFSEKELKRKKALWTKLSEKKMPPETFFANLVNKHFYQSDIITIKNEVKMLKDNDVKLIVTGFHYNSNVSARKANIPLVYIVSGAIIPPYFKQKLASFPDNYENLFSRFYPKFSKNFLTNYFFLNCKWSVKEFNRLARAFNTHRINHFLDLFSGDYTLVAEDIAFLNLKPTAEFPTENFVGPILPETMSLKEDFIDDTVKRHLEKPEKSVLVSLGSSGTKELFFKILYALEKTDFNVIAIYTTILNKNEIPFFKDNILPVQFVPSIKKVMGSVDFVIIHGGRGTVYTAAYTGKPVIGIPMQIEQQCNIDNLVRHGTAIRLSKRNLSTKKLLLAVDKIFTNYDIFFNNAQILKKKLQEPKGAENAAKRLLEIVDKR